MTANPLEIPELLAAILAQVSSPASLLACALVNKLWLKLAIPVLWAKPPVSRLADLSNNPDLQQHYANMVRVLDFDDDYSSDDDCDSVSQSSSIIDEDYSDPDDHAVNQRNLCSLKFPRLTEVIFNNPTGFWDEQHLWQYLQPSLRRFAFYGGIYSYNNRSNLTNNILERL
ncbi:MAG: hypothetical protein M1837_001439 [Sclerophora amabilis]|nr:MAG: hypothetical protein M1837_001439 [Sclerophora amabilis]